MEDTRMVAACSPRLPRIGHQLEPLLPAKATKRKRLNAVLDKLANNIKVAPESPDDDGDNNLEFEINVKTKIKKESDPSSESDESDNERRNVENSGDIYDTDRSPMSSVSSPKEEVDSPNICLSPTPIKSEHHQSSPKNSNIFFGSQLNSPSCDSRASSNQEKLPESNLSQLRLTPLPNQPSSPTPSMMSSYEQYIKSQLLSKMYLQQYMTNNLTKPFVLPNQTADENKTEPSSHHSNGDKSQTKKISKESHVFLDGPLDLSTRQTDSLSIVTKDSLAQSLKERLYSQQFPFPPFPQMLMQNPALQSRSHDESPSSKIKQESTAVVETSSAKKDPTYVCPICGQMFSLHDRLAKHMASRHKSKASDSSSKAYFCDVCKRSFARSDMLTRHMRLHTGIKPYTCRVCGQVFSRSDHLSTHQRTHTGEKPYKCPSCPYSACRRDMITRHMRTHSRYELQDSSSIAEESDKESNGHSGAAPNLSGEAFKFVKEEVVDS
jgi:DNA-directed RNA polymerase subunit RPC12/RpoP